MNKLDIHNICFADFTQDFNKTRQSALDIIEREGGRPSYYFDASQKNYV